MLDVNDQTLQVFGYTRQEMLEADLGALMGAGFTGDMAMDRIRRAFDGERLEFEWVGKRKSG